MDASTILLPLHNIQLPFVSAWTLLIGHREENPTYKVLGDDVLAWLFIWSEEQMIVYSHVSADALPPIVYSLFKIQNGFTFPVLTYAGPLGK